MELHDPVAIYNAANNMEAHLVRNALADAKIEAFVAEDLSAVGGWVGGLIPEIHKPQVWVERADIERARPVLEEYERRAAELRSTAVQEEGAGPSIDVVCEECGEHSTFPAAQRGSVQECQHCGAFVDVADGAERGPESPPEE